MAKVNCPRCEGRKEVASKEGLADSESCRWITCPRCHGLGEVDGPSPLAAIVDKHVRRHLGMSYDNDASDEARAGWIAVCEAIASDIVVTSNATRICVGCGGALGDPINRCSDCLDEGIDRLRKALGMI